jgi:hypothetical protein
MSLGVRCCSHFACGIRIPAGVRTGSRQRYTLTVSENADAGFLTAPAVRGTADPEVIHFQ